jgi:hypothetical protein
VVVTPLYIHWAKFFKVCTLYFIVCKLYINTDEKWKNKTKQNWVGDGLGRESCGRRTCV